MKTKAILSQYLTEMDQGMISNSVSGRPLSVSTVRTRMSDISIIASAVGDADINDPALGTILRKNLEQTRSESTIAKAVNLLRIVIRRYNPEYSNRSLKFTAKEKPVLSLTRAQVRFLIDNYDVIRGDVKHRGMRSALDYAVIGLMFGARIGDMRSWTTENYVERDGGMWLVYSQSKTGARVELPCPDLARRIFERNSGFVGMLMPAVSGRINESLRSVFSRFPELASIADSVHMHTMRASCATYLLASGAPEMYVKSVTGHAQDSKAFRRYVAVHDDLKVDYKNLISK
jgi:integrase